MKTFIDKYTEDIQMHDPIWGYAVLGEYLHWLISRKNVYIKAYKSKKSDKKTKKDALRNLIRIDLAEKYRLKKPNKDKETNE